MKTLTIWQTRIGDEWRYADAEIAALACYAGNQVRLVDVPAQAFLKIDHEPRVSRREVTPARLRASERAIVRNVSRAGLFAGIEHAQQPTPEDRIRQIDDGIQDRQRQHRKLCADQWREVRRELRALPEHQRASVIYRFNCFGGPRVAHTLAYMLRQHTQKNTNIQTSRAA